jgi:hypothetical protein
MAALETTRLEREGLFSMGEKLRRAGVSEEAIFGVLRGLLS